ncbi:unnamed protein product [Darwinula stevensoni]|uniref:Uncharacterized protein n=1 Tax=Darwinula stevensoni TaxID=69355 RepID=A0A7R9AHC7_9CRUS|nr:unnamed protein product [Darwinula stevensoni]CAG0904579.1 unnamed protein product [Darwinula stevensoni]
MQGEGEDDDLVFKDALYAAPYRTWEMRSPQWGWPWGLPNDASSTTTTTTTVQNRRGIFSDDFFSDEDLVGSGQHGGLEGSGDPLNIRLWDSVTLTAQSHQGMYTGLRINWDDEDDEDYELVGSGHHGGLEGSGDLLNSFIPACAEGKFTCGNGACIDADRRCDTVEDCEDGSDEVDCKVACGVGQFVCDVNRCIDGERRCDRVYDCQDRTDEDFCRKSLSSSEIPSSLSHKVTD